MLPFTSSMIEASGKTFTNGVKTLGAVTVAFFLLLAAMIYLAVYLGPRVIEAHDDQEEQLSDIEDSIFEIQNDRSQDAKLEAYFLREICRNSATTELQKQACNPPPSLLDNAN